VITMALIGKIRGMRMRDGKSISEISRLTSLSRNTIKKWLKVPQCAAPKYRRRDVSTKLAPFLATLRQALEVDARRAKHERRTARALHAQLRAQGYEGGYTRLTDFIREWRLSQGKSAGMHAFVPLAFELGEAFQFDWSEEGLVVGGIYYRVQVSHMKLCASRAFWLVAYPSQGHEMLFDAHTRSFAALGGIPRRGIYDNMKTAVDKVRKGKGRVVNARFAVMCAHYLFDADFCNVASGWEKGVVEKNVQDSRRRIWIDAAKLRFGSFVELNAWIADRCRSLWAEVRHPEHDQFSVAEMLEHERAHLMPCPSPSTATSRSPRGCRARAWCQWRATATRCRASWPGRWSARGCTRAAWSSWPTTASPPATSGSAMPGRRATTGSTTSRCCRGSPAPEPLQQLRRALLRSPGGDRVMAQVLAIVPTAGLDAVLVAVELALESGPPSGRVSVEHVVNVLGRLNATPAPQNAATTLQVATPPLANTARYDSLRADTTDNAAEEAGHA